MTGRNSRTYPVGIPCAAPLHGLTTFCAKTVTTMSKLRDHIADVLADHPAFNLKDDGYSAEDILKMADVLVFELGMTNE